MEQAKAGNFEELGNGNVRIERMSEDKNQKITEYRKEYFELETGDFEIEYLAEDKNAKIEAGF
jgi:hypothetical protein